MWPEPVVSIIICTRNRADSLRETLASVGRVLVPSDLPAELLVVDNGSTDHTRQITEESDLQNMPVRYISEPRKGKGYAYNTGMSEASGDVFIFTDDDVRVPEDWIEGMCRPILAGEADAVAGGVQLAPDLVQPWMELTHRVWLASTEHLVNPAAVTLVGANMAFGRHVRQKVPWFDVELGPGAIGFGDETLFAAQLSAAGHTIQKRLVVAVEHHFDGSRLTPASFVKRATDAGRADAYIAYHWWHSENRFRCAKYLALAALRKALLCMPGGRYSSAAPALRAHYKYGLSAQTLVEMRRPRNYEKQGLAKLRGILWSEDG